MLIFYLPTAVPLVPKPRPKGKTMAMPLLVNLGNEATMGLDPKLLDTSFIIASDSCMFRGSFLWNSLLTFSFQTMTSNVSPKFRFCWMSQLNSTFSYIINLFPQDQDWHWTLWRDGGFTGLQTSRAIRRNDGLPLSPWRHWPEWWLDWQWQQRCKLGPLPVHRGWYDLSIGYDIMGCSWQHRPGVQIDCSCHQNIKGCEVHLWALEHKHRLLYKWYVLWHCHWTSLSDLESWTGGKFCITPLHFHMCTNSVANLAFTNGHSRTSRRGCVNSAWSGKDIEGTVTGMLPHTFLAAELMFEFPAAHQCGTEGLGQGAQDCRPTKQQDVEKGWYTLWSRDRFDYWIHLTLDFITAILTDSAHQKPTQSDVDRIVSHLVIPRVLLL